MFMREEYETAFFAPLKKEEKIMKKRVRMALYGAGNCERRAFEAANRGGLEIVCFEEELRRTTAALAAGSEIVCVCSTCGADLSVARELAASGVRLMVLRCGGCGDAGVAELGEYLDVIRVSGRDPRPVAEYAAGLLLTLNRHYHQSFYNAVSKGIFSGGLPGFGLYGRTAGIVGTGASGRILARILRGFGMRVLAYDPEPDFEAANMLKFKYVRLPELWRHSDVISLHCPLNAETFHLLDRRAFAGMKDGVLIVNTARSGLIDMPALAEALRSGRVGGIGMDICDGAPGDGVLEALMLFPNVLITERRGGFTREIMKADAEAVIAAVRAYLSGRMPEELVYRSCRREAVECGPRLLLTLEGVYR